MENKPCDNLRLASGIVVEKHGQANVCDNNNRAWRPSIANIQTYDRGK